MQKFLLNNDEDWNIFCRSHEKQFVIYPAHFNMSPPELFPCILLYYKVECSDGNYPIWEFVYQKDFNL